MWGEGIVTRATTYAIISNEPWREYDTQAGKSEAQLLVTDWRKAMLNKSVVEWAYIQLGMNGIK